MATGRLLVLPLALILLLYIRNLLAIVEQRSRTEKRSDGKLSGVCVCMHETLDLLLGIRSY